MTKPRTRCANPHQDAFAKHRASKARASPRCIQTRHKAARFSHPARQHAEYGLAGTRRAATPGRQARSAALHTETMLSSHAPPRLRGSAGEQDVPAQLLTSQLLSGTQNLTGAKQSTLIPLDSIRLRTPVDTSLPARSRGATRDAAPPQPRYIRTIPPLDRCTAERKPARGNNSNPRDGRTPTRG